MMAAAREGGVKKRQLCFQQTHTLYSECESRGEGGGGKQAEVTASGGAVGKKQQQTATERADLNEVRRCRCLLPLLLPLAVLWKHFLGEA